MSERALTVLTGPPMKIPTAVMKYTVSMSPETTPESAMEYMEQVCAAVGVGENTLSRLHVLLGQMAYSVKKYGLYKPAYKKWGPYMEYLEGKHGLKKSSINNCIAAVQVLQISPEEAEKIPVRNLVLATQAARNAEPRQLKQIKIDAANLQAPELRAKFTSKKLIVARGRPEGGFRESGIVRLGIYVTTAFAQRFRKQAEAYDTPAKYLSYLVSLEPKKAAA